MEFNSKLKGGRQMKGKTTAEKRENTLDEIDIAKMEVEAIQLQLKENLEHINRVLSQMEKIRKIISCLIYLKLNWLDNDYNESQLKDAEERLKNRSNLYEVMILKRKLLKAQFKQAQRKFSKKQKSIKRFDEKYFPKIEKEFQTSIVD